MISRKEAELKWQFYNETDEEYTQEMYIQNLKLSQQYPYIYTQWGTLLSEDFQQ
jgi:hypothetical protein